MNTEKPVIAVAQARAVADRVVYDLGLAIEGGFEVCGALRRQRQRISEIDLIAPLPAPGGVDRLGQEILRRFTRRSAAGSLFRAELPTESMGWIEEAPLGFRRCELRFVQRFIDGSAMEVPVRIQRYVPGPAGNRGLVQVYRTGPAMFVSWLLDRYRLLRGGQAAACREMFLLDRSGRPMAAASERAVFEMARIGCVEPVDRCSERAKVWVVGSGRVGGGSCGAGFASGIASGIGGVSLSSSSGSAA